nr:ATP-binding protein [Bacillus sp. REN16]
MFFIAILLLSITIILIYRNITSYSTIFLFSLTIGYTLSFIGLVLYLSKSNISYKIVSKFFNFTPGSWNYLVLQNFDPNFLIRLLNFGAILFYLCFLLFSISYTNSRIGNRKMIPWYIVLTIIAIMQYIFYDPKINLFLQNVAIDHNLHGLYNSYIKVVDKAFMYLNIGFIVIGIVLFIRYYIAHSHIRFIKRYTLFNLIGLFLLACVYLSMFSWAPDILVRATFSTDYPNYLHPSMSNFLLNIQIFPLIAVLILVFMAYIVFKYNSIEMYYKNLVHTTDRRIDTASLGIRAFTHSIKNHLVAIRSEAEYLKERAGNDEEAHYSLDLIHDYCQQAFNRIEDAGNKLNQITLNFQAIDLDIPVKTALKRVNLKNSKILLKYHPANHSIIVRGDEDHLQESIYNMIKNALEVVSAETGIVEVEVEEIGDWGVIIIKDNGSGIQTDNFNEIFPLFIRRNHPQQIGE